MQIINVKCIILPIQMLFSTSLISFLFYHPAALHAPLTKFKWLIDSNYICLLYKS